MAESLQVCCRRSGIRVWAVRSLARLSELLFVEAIRSCIEALPADQTGWLAGVRDRYVDVRCCSMLNQSIPDR
jgi:hypothetical protein